MRPGCGKLLSTLEGEDYPASPRRAVAQIRQATLGGQLEVPNVDLETDIGGYPKVKKRLRAEILDVLAAKDQATDPAEITRMEKLIPRGMIFWGPPGTGKTLFAKGMATALGAAITIVSGPELKSRWVGESEENLRLIFHRARQSAPSIIVFDELDSFASARGHLHRLRRRAFDGQPDAHRDGRLSFGRVGVRRRHDELCGKPRPALLRPGRFEFHLHIPYPDRDDRREILKIYDAAMELGMDEETLEYAVKRTGEYVEGAVLGTRFSGDHINALCRALARIRLREKIDRPTTTEDIERALTEWIDRPKMTPKEQHVVATHEAGHAVCALFCEHATPIERISIQGDAAGALGFVQYQDPAHKYVVTRGQLLDDLCILMGGREAEQLLLDDLSIGSADDLRRATNIARALVEEFGMGGDAVGVCRYEADDDRQPGRFRQLSPAQLEHLDRRVRELLEEARHRAAAILAENQTLVETLRDLLIDRKVIDAKSLGSLTGKAVGDQEKT